MPKVTADKRHFNSTPMATVQHYIRDIRAGSADDRELRLDLKAKLKIRMGREVNVFMKPGVAGQAFSLHP